MLQVFRQRDEALKRPAMPDLFAARTEGNERATPSSDFFDSPQLCRFRRAELETHRWRTDAQLFQVSQIACDLGRIQSLVQRLLVREEEERHHFKGARARAPRRDPARRSARQARK